MSSLFDADSPSNLTEYSVSELSGSIKRTVETAFDQVRVRGEISGYRGPHSSGHAYFSLKDDRARIDAVIWKGTMGRLKFRPEEGMEVVATGKITTFPGSSKYQIVIDTLEPAGAGALMALIEERKRRLGAEGLFDPARKQLLPFLPRVIGVVTSPTGAVIRDILHRLADRFPVDVVLWPVKVQGEGCGEEVARAINGFNALTGAEGIPRPDVLIVARGGGSLEDLWGFNDEVVVRAAAASAIPLISAVGHETDWTLIDYVADMRAPTPTGAAEMAVPVRADLLAQTAGLGARLRNAQVRQMESRRQELRGLMRAFPSLDQLLALPRRRFDEAAAALGRGLELNTLSKRRRFERVAAELRPETMAQRLQVERQRLSQRIERIGRSVERLVDLSGARLHRVSGALDGVPLRLAGEYRRLRERLESLSRHGDTALVNRLNRHRQMLAAQDRMLQSLSYRNVLKRGYAVVRDAEGRPVSLAASLAAGQAVGIEFADGRIGATVGEGPAEPAAQPPSPAPSRKRSPKPGEGGSGQGSLF
ncbi:exodeoxyribonuclease VII large subunit [Gellertiella hungarica]|uniref:Exodeoxyribonuclease 7 large subunit n=1 Tax=Gellertiella hungarica TaxID=1572859 RepID=A0A7W6NME0_9HYPH|nr:exodeoxyribonuclease VII large subunit [Gellertiella hungarica]MBB4066370.1 exodeoxyribonuclease VII large subunit [Gellertiella hungarica]